MTDFEFGLVLEIAEQFATLDSPGLTWKLGDAAGL